MSALDAVLLIAFGGPERSEDIRPFLQRVAAGRRIPPERLEEVAHHYELIGGRSPLNELTLRQADALRRLLERDGVALPVYVAMRNWHPFLDGTLAEMKGRGHRRAVGIILSAFQAEASWERYIGDVARAREKVGADAPEVFFAPPWFDHPRFIEAVSDRAANALARVSRDRRRATPLVFTAHSVPKAMADGSPYVAQFTTASRSVAERLNRSRWSLAYQSRSGSPDEPWLEPDISDVLRELAAERAGDVVVVPIGFVSDHVEVLYDLDIEARRLADTLGLRLHRAAAVNDHPAFAAMLAELVRARLAT